MRPRSELLLALGLFGGLLALGAALGAKNRGTDEAELRASSYFAGPYGVRALADGLRHMQVTVQSSRRLLPDLAKDTTTTGRRLVAIINPADPPSGAEQETLLATFATSPGTDLLLAGQNASPLIRCFGYTVGQRPFESVIVRPLALTYQRERTDWPRLSAVLGSSTASIVVDSSRTDDALITTCVVPPVQRVDTLLMSETGRVLALRLYRDDVDQRVLLVADPALLRNRALRESPAGPYFLGLIAAEYDRVVFDEMHQGFRIGGSMLDALLAWSQRSPWGWAAWQLAIVGILALLAGAIRFGPVRAVLTRKRRSPLEHVHALANALAASRGHDVAIGSIVQGLHRRLNPGTRHTRVEWRGWVDRLVHQLRSPRAQEAARTLQSLTRPGQPSEGVLRAANAVEDVWEELRP